VTTVTVSREARRGERGQSTVMIVSLLMVFMLLTSMVVNVSQAVNRRVALQIVADAGAWTGATSMAVGMNKLAEINQYIQAFWSVMTIGVVGFTVTECDVGDASVDVYDAARTILGIAYHVMNVGWAQMPRLEARKVSTTNIYDLFPGENPDTFEMDETDNEPDARLKQARDQLFLAPSEEVPDGTDPDFPVYLSGSRKSAQWVCFTVWPPSIQSRSHNFDVWFQRGSTSVQYFVWRVTSPPVDALLFNEFFGPIPEMKAVGVAKPVGGDIKKGDDDYITKMMPTSRVIGSFFDTPWSDKTVLDDRNRKRQVTH
jgi:hypothetical protein